MSNNFDIAIVGAGAAGLMAAIWAARSDPSQSIILIDGANKLGAKILISGGARCNITNKNIRSTDFAGGSRNAIKKVLKEFTSAETILFFNQLGVKTKEEPLGKIFPVSNSAKEVVSALLKECEKQEVLILNPYRVGKIDFANNLFEIMSVDNQAAIFAKKVILATGGMALPKSGSDGKGYSLSKTFGHTTTRRIFPALVPLTMEKGNFIISLKGITIPTKLTIRFQNGKKGTAFEGSTLFTHFGLSGPPVLNISRYFINEQLDDKNIQLEINFLPEITDEIFEQELFNTPNKTIFPLLKNYLPQRLCSALLHECEIEEQLRTDQLPKIKRIKMINMIFNYHLPITGNRGFTYAEVTAGGTPLSEIYLNSMESRIKPNLFLCGEILNVDGKIGGYNFQWAWSSGVIAGKNAASS